MWMSNIFIVINSKNADHNTLMDIAAGAIEAGAQIINIDDQKHVIEAAIKSHDVALITSIDGVSYVRTAFTYLNTPSLALAA